MDREKRILRFMSGRNTTEEGRALIKEMREDGTLCELIFSEVASMFLYSREELLEVFSPEEVDEIDKMREFLLESALYLGKTSDKEEKLRAVAEEEKKNKKDGNKKEDNK